VSPPLGACVGATAVGVGWEGCVSVGVEVGLASGVVLWLGELGISVRVAAAPVGVGSTCWGKVVGVTWAAGVDVFSS
jgi:hypothetical protein